jgi:hypothetical protein
MFSTARQCPTVIERVQKARFGLLNCRASVRRRMEDDLYARKGKQLRKTLYCCGVAVNAYIGNSPKFIDIPVLLIPMWQLMVQLPIKQAMRHKTLLLVHSCAYRGVHARFPPLCFCLSLPPHPSPDTTPRASPDVSTLHQGRPSATHSIAGCLLSWLMGFLLSCSPVSMLPSFNDTSA